MSLFSARVAPSRDQNGWTTTPINFSHAIYLILEEFPGIRQSEIRSILRDRDYKIANLGGSIQDLYKGGYIRYSQAKGTLQDVDDRMKFRWSVTDKMYKPKAVMKKVKPVIKVLDEIQPKTIDVQKAQHLSLVQGIATVDASDPVFGETAKEIIGKVETKSASESATENKPLITGIFVDIGTQSIIVTPAQFRQLFLEMKAMIGE